jgi:hypothetical protein
MEPQPRVFHYSLDWRFLLPIADSGNICLLLEENKDFSQTLEQVGIHASQQVSFADLRQTKNNKIQTLVLPFGLSAAWTGTQHKNQVEFYASVRRLIVPDGYLLIGFNNIWNVRASSPTKYYASTPRRIADQLKQAGFRSIHVFGAMPNLAIPDYIFDLETRAIQFALRNRFRRKPAVLRALRLFEATVSSASISNFLPCYFTVAAA